MFAIENGYLVDTRCGARFTHVGAAQAFHGEERPAGLSAYGRNPGEAINFARESFPRGWDIEAVNVRVADLTEEQQEEALGWLALAEHREALQEAGVL